MKITFLIVNALFLLSCGGGNPVAKEKAETPIVSPDTGSVPEKVSKFQSLLDKFKNISIDTFKIFSEHHFKKFKGIAITNAEAKIFPEEIANSHFFDPPGIFACYKFSIDENRIALIARTPSEYIPSSIKLLVFDRNKDEITGYIELAESWGDAGDSYIVDSWIFKDKNKSFQALIWVQSATDPSVFSDEDTLVETWDYHYLVDLSTPKFDTVSRNSKALKKRFKNLLN